MDAVTPTPQPNQQPGTEPLLKSAPPSSGHTTTMPKPSGSAPRSNKGLIILLVVLLVIAGGGYAWWQLGFTFDISRFFAAETGTMQVQCGDTENVITWTPDSSANSNSIQRGNTGAKNLPDCADYWCWLPSNNYPHQVPTTTTPAQYVDSNLQQGVCYEYRIKYRPDLPSNSVFCPVNCNVVTTPTPSPTPTVTPTPTAIPLGTLSCSVSPTTAGSGAPVAFTAQNGTDISWSAPAGSPTSGTGTSFVTTFSHSGPEETRSFDVTVSDADTESEATCSVSVQCTAPSCAVPPEGCSYVDATSCSCGTLVCESPSPTPQIDNLTCEPSSQTVEIDEVLTIEASGGSGVYSWSAPNGTAESSSSGSEYQVSYDTAGGYTVSVSDGITVVNCGVNVEAVAETPEPTSTPEAGDPSLRAEKTVRNISQGTGETESTPARSGETVEYIVRVTNRGDETAEDVELFDPIPAGLTYVNGSVTVNGSGVGTRTPLLTVLLDAIAPDQTRTVRYRAIVDATSASGTRDIENIARVSASNSNRTDSDGAIVIVVGPEETIIPTVAIVDTGPGQASVLALVISAIVTLLYVGYTSTDMFRRREVSDYSRGRRHPDFRG